MGKSAFITGITGQDGAWLAKLLLEEGYRVFGGVRRCSERSFHRLNRLGIQDLVAILPFDLIDGKSIEHAIRNVRPDEFYNLAAQSHVGESFSCPELTYQTNAMGVVRILTTLERVSPNTRFYQASTSEMFGGGSQLSESSPFMPRSPYAESKLAAHWATVNAKVFACSGILFNHESELRGDDFVTRKVTKHVARVKHGYKGVIELGNLDARRDWGYAPEYCEGMWRMMQLEDPADYVLATGRATSVREFVSTAFAVIGVDIAWISDRGIDVKSGELLVKTSTAMLRPNEVECLSGDASRACSAFGWRAETGIEGLIAHMVEKDLDLLKS